LDENLFRLITTFDEVRHRRGRKAPRRVLT
jgi:hypothetical protein